MGHLISADGIRPLKDKLDSIRDMPTPCNSKEVKQFLGLIGYYRKFVPCFAAISRPLSKLTCKDKIFEWTTECESAFITLRKSCALNQFYNMRTLLKVTLCTLMQASTDGQGYSPSLTQP